MRYRRCSSRSSVYVTWREEDRPAVVRLSLLACGNTLNQMLSIGGVHVLFFTNRTSSNALGSRDSRWTYSKIAGASAMVAVLRRLRPRKCTQPDQWTHRARRAKSRQQYARKVLRHSRSSNKPPIGCLKALTLHAKLRFHRRSEGIPATEATAAILIRSWSKPDVLLC